METAKRNEFLRRHYPLLYNALNLHRTHRNEYITFKNYAYMKDLYLDPAKQIVVMKSTQCGVSEYALVRVIHEASGGRGIIYVLPTQGLQYLFVKERFDRTMLMSPYYTAMFKNTEDTDNASIKGIGKGSVVFTASMSPVGLTSHPADTIVIDEFDICSQEYLPMVDGRLSNSKDPKKLIISNPSIAGYGIDAEYKASDRKVWKIRCEACGEWFSPDFFTNVVRITGEGRYEPLDGEFQPDSGVDARMFCRCGKPVDRYSPGRWEATEKGSVSGYHITKLFSTREPLGSIIERYRQGLMNEGKLQAFYNADLGVPYTSKGSQIDFQMLEDSKEDYLMPDSVTGKCIMGVDVGKSLHIVIRELLADGRQKTVFIGERIAFNDVKDLYRRFNCVAGVVDALPETRLSMDLAMSCRGMFVSFFGNMKKEIGVNQKDHTVTTDRTTSIDMFKEEVVSKQIIHPKNADKILPIDKNGFSCYYNHIQSSTRKLNEKRNEYEWVEGNNPDHFLLASTYASIAKKLLAHVNRAQVIVI